ncbi:MAG: LAGLIDADG family homing endonuclease [Candidatus Woesebacteria bacterium]
MKWSADLAYVVGLITTDGSLSKDGRHIDFTSKDINLIRTFAGVLKLKNKIGLKSSSYGKGKTYYRIQFGNVKFYHFLVDIGLTPNKTKTLGSLTIPKEYFIDFLRGHLDGDGYTFSYWDKRWKSSFMLYTGFISASKPHLEWIQKEIKTLWKLDGALNFSGRSTYHLMYAKKSSVALLEKVYYKDCLPCLERKQSKIMQSMGIIRQEAQVV